MANQWFRMYSEFATDAKVQSMSEAMQRRLMMLFCLRCSNGIATLQCNELAFALHITEEELEETKALFVRKGFIDDAWNVLNWDKRQFISDSSTDRSRKHREAKRKAKRQSNDGATYVQRCSNDGATAPDTDTDTDTDTDISPLPPSRKGEEADADRFAEFWACWPKNDRKQDRAKCSAKWAKEKLDSVSAKIVADVEAKKRTQKWREGFVEAPLVYLNNRRWEDGDAASAPDWWLSAGFETVWQAQNAGCNARNAHEFRDGKRIMVPA